MYFHGGGDRDIAHNPKDLASARFGQIVDGEILPHRS
jgi:hypothetical protein